MNEKQKKLLVLLTSGVVIFGLVYLFLFNADQEVGSGHLKREHSKSNQDVYNSLEDLIKKGLEHDVLVEGFIRDNEGNPVAGSEVMVSLPLASGGKSPISLTTDRRGAFKIEGVRSPSLFIQAIPPKGYVTTSDSSKKIDLFVGKKVALPKESEADFEMEGEFRNPTDPIVLFVKQIAGADPVFVRRVSSKLPKDGRERYFRVDGAIITPLSEKKEGGHQLLVQCWTDLENRIPSTRPGANYSHLYSWRFRVSVPGGGVVRALSLGEDDVLAPDSGYNEHVEISMDRDVKEENWNSGQKMRIYFKFSDSTYGRADILMETDGSHYVNIDSVFNPSGGRNTLVDKSKLLGN